MGRWLEQRGKLHQPISVLRLEELEGIAWAVVTEYTSVREEKRRELGAPLDVHPELPEPLERYLTG